MHSICATYITYITIIMTYYDYHYVNCPYGRWRVPSITFGQTLSASIVAQHCWVERRCWQWPSQLLSLGQPVCMQTTDLWGWMLFGMVLDPDEKWSSKTSSLTLNIPVATCQKHGNKPTNNCHTLSKHARNFPAKRDLTALHWLVRRDAHSAFIVRGRVSCGHDPLTICFPRSEGLFNPIVSPPHPHLHLSHPAPLGRRSRSDHGCQDDVTQRAQADGEKWVEK